jgi:hypothetical protein
VASISREEIMSDFVYTVFLIVASMIGALLTVFAIGVIGVLFYETHHTSEPATPAAPAELHRAA